MILPLLLTVGLLAPLKAIQLQCETVTVIIAPAGAKALTATRLAADSMGEKVCTIEVVSVTHTRKPVP
jgi:hypothetical protein